MSFGLIDTLKKAHPVTQLCAVLDVHKSSYYYWHSHRQPSMVRLGLQTQVKAIHAEVSQTYGSRRMSQALQAIGLSVGRDKARNLMREVGAVAVQPRKRHVYPTGEVSRIADNHLDRAFEAEAPNQKWVGDITYLWTSTGWIYLAVVLDLYSRKVIGWQLSDSPNTTLILNTLNQAVILRQITKESGLLFHSDQGCQYTSHAYQERLTELGIQASMSRRGNCWDNAVMERFFRSLKVESTSRYRFQSREQLTWTVKKYIHFYNTKRIHSYIGAISPNQFERVSLKAA
jgi:putative transposase